MKQYAGIDVSLEYSSVCVVDADGRIVREAKVLSEPDALIAWFGAHGVAMERIGLEAGPLSQWLHAGMAKAGLCVELIETRHVRSAFKTMPVKTDKKDARGIAQLMRLGWFRPVHCKSLAAQEVRALLTARKLIQGKLHDIEMSLRGILRGFGLKVGPTTRRTYAGRIRELVAGHSTLQAIAASLLKVRDALVQEFAGFERQLRAIARQDENAQRLMTTPGVGVLVAPKKYQSGETDHSGRISKIGDGSVRTALYEAANVILTRPLKGSDLKGWALAVARRAGPRKARVALARKLAVVLHCLLRDRTNFIPHKRAPALAA